nr:hypothetical protein [Aminithiophilus ramosus]
MKAWRPSTAVWASRVMSIWTLPVPTTLRVTLSMRSVISFVSRVTVRPSSLRMASWATLSSFLTEPESRKPRLARMPSPSVRVIALSAPVSPLVRTMRRSTREAETRAVVSFSDPQAAAASLIFDEMEARLSEASTVTSTDPSVPTSTEKVPLSPRAVEASSTRSLAMRWAWAFWTTSISYWAMAASAVAVAVTIPTLEEAPSRGVNSVALAE